MCVVKMMSHVCCGVYNVKTSSQHTCDITCCSGKCHRVLVDLEWHRHTDVIIWHATTTCEMLRYSCVTVMRHVSSCVRFKYKVFCDWSTHHMTCVLFALSRGCLARHFPHCSAKYNWFCESYANNTVPGNKSVPEKVLPRNTPKFRRYRFVPR